MNEIIESIKTRRSVRKWTNQPVSEDDVLDIIAAGMNAPSAGNEQAWQIIVLTDDKIKAEYASFNQNAAYVKNSPVAILVCGDLTAQKYNGFYVHDCCAATENMLLAIHSKGMGGVWCNVFPDAITGIKKLMNLPDNIVPFSIVPFGYPDRTPNFEDRFDKTKLHLNSW